MTSPQIRFDDGASYEEFMGKWSRLTGDVFLDWLAPPAGLGWLDVGCGNGAFSEMLAQRCAPTAVEGIDPSEPQLAYARGHAPAGAPLSYRVGDAMSLPYADASFDAAVMALVIFFVPDPPKSVAEMARVVRPGGSISTYAWDLLGGGFPYMPIFEAMEEMGFPLPGPPSPEASRLDALRALWQGAGLVELETKTIEVRREYESFDRYWEIARTGPRMSTRIGELDETGRARLRENLRRRVEIEPSGRLVRTARANAIKGRVPA
jgi:SAM-dependent methyltransferase